MKKLILLLAIFTLSLTAQAQNLLTFKINAKVLISTGDSIPTGAVCSFTAHVENVGVTGKISYDISWYYSATARTNNWDRVWACTDRTNRIGSRLVSYEQTVADPTAVSYTAMRDAIKAWLESVYGVGNVAVI